MFSRFCVNSFVKQNKKLAMHSIYRGYSNFGLRFMQSESNTNLRSVQIQMNLRTKRLARNNAIRRFLYEKRPWIGSHRSILFGGRTIRRWNYSTNLLPFFSAINFTLPFTEMHCIFMLKENTKSSLYRRYTTWSYCHFTFFFLDTKFLKPSQ